MKDKAARTGMHKIEKLIHQLSQDIPDGEDKELAIAHVTSTLYGIIAADVAESFFLGYHSAEANGVLAGIKSVTERLDTDEIQNRLEHDDLNAADDLTIQWLRVSARLGEAQQQLSKEHYETLVDLVSDTADALNNTFLAHLAGRGPDMARQFEKDAIRRSTAAAGQKSAQTRSKKKRAGQAWYQENRGKFRTKSEAAMAIKEQFNVAFDTALTWIKGI